MTRFFNITGERFGRLTALRMVGKRPTRWLYQCDCGNKKRITMSDVSTGHTQSCGCLRMEMIASGNAKRKGSTEWHQKSARRRIEKYSMPEPNSGCWIWLGALDRRGYGKLGVQHKGTALAHRLSYKLFVGDPGELLVCHKCDVPACVNPEHLFVGTHRDNVRDCMKKGRHRPRGVLQPPVNF